MAPSRRCTECGASLAGKRKEAVVCSPACRSKRHRRVGAGKSSGRSVEQLTHDEVEKAAQEALKEAVAPVVRESLTDEVLAALGTLVGLVPSAVEALKEDLAGDDHDRRQRAYTQLLRYTAGHGALVPDQTDQTRHVTVLLDGIPHAPTERPAVTEATNGHADLVSLKECDTCHVSKPADAEHFVGASDRCWDCFNKIRSSVDAIEAHDGG